MMVRLNTLNCTCVLIRSSGRIQFVIHNVDGAAVFTLHLTSHVTGLIQAIWEGSTRNSPEFSVILWELCFPVRVPSRVL